MGGAGLWQGRGGGKGLGDRGRQRVMGWEVRGAAPLSLGEEKEVSGSCSLITGRPSRPPPTLHPAPDVTPLTLAEYTLAAGPHLRAAPNTFVQVSAD